MATLATGGQRVLRRADFGAGLDERFAALARFVQRHDDLEAHVIGALADIVVAEAGGEQRPICKFSMQTIV